jgi:hypothetical protein
MRVTGARDREAGCLLGGVQPRVAVVRHGPQGEGIIGAPDNPRLACLLLKEGSLKCSYAAVRCDIRAAHRWMDATGSQVTNTA